MTGKLKVSCLECKRESTLVIPVDVLNSAAESIRLDHASRLYLTDMRVTVGDKDGRAGVFWLSGRAGSMRKISGLNRRLRRKEWQDQGICSTLRG
jgi:hypothetical protein